MEEIQREYSQQREYGSTPSFAISSDGENIPQESLKASGNLQYLSATGEEEDVDSLPVECSIHTLNAIKERIYGAVHSYQSSRRDRLANAFIDKVV